VDSGYRWFKIATYFPCGSYEREVDEIAEFLSEFSLDDILKTLISYIGSKLPKGVRRQVVRYIFVIEYFKGK